MELRDYQKDAVAYALPKILRNERPVLQLPTGSGKSLIAFSTLNMYNGLMAAQGQEVYNGWITHRHELIDQMSKSAHKMGIRTIRMEAGIDTMSIPYYLYFISSARRKAYDSPENGLLIVDESHHAVASSWEKKIKKWKGPVLGLSATPWRLKKGEGFTHIFSDLYTGPQPRELVNQGHLAKVKVIVPSNKVQKYNLDIIAGDYSTKSMTSEITKLLSGGVALNQWRQHANNTQTMWCVPTIRAAKMLNNYLRNNGEQSEIITSETPKLQRDKIVNKYARKQLRHIIQVDVLSEGVDFPDVQTVCSMRPTKSKVIYLQQVGRGTRPKRPDNNCTLIDFADNMSMFGHPQSDRHWSLEPVPAFRGQGIKGNCWNCQEAIHPKISYCPICDAGINFRCVSDKTIPYLKDSKGLACGRRLYYTRFPKYRNTLCYGCEANDPTRLWKQNSDSITYQPIPEYTFSTKTNELKHNDNSIHKLTKPPLKLDHLIEFRRKINDHRSKMKIQHQQELRARREKERLAAIEARKPKINIDFRNKTKNPTTNCHLQLRKVKVTQSRQGNDMIIWTFDGPQGITVSEYSTWHNKYRKNLAVKLVEMLNIPVQPNGDFSPEDALNQVLREVPVTTSVYNNRRSYVIDWDALISWEDFQIDYKGKDTR